MATTHRMILLGQANRASVKAAYNRLGPKATVKAIAAETGLDPRTVSDHLIAIRGRIAPPRRSPVREKPPTRAQVRAAIVQVRLDHLAATRDPAPPPPPEPKTVAEAAKRDYFRAWRRIRAKPTAAPAPALV